MENVKIEAHGSVAILRLNNGVTNAISSELVSDLSVALGQIKSEFKGMVLAGGTKFFSIGLELPGLLQLDHRSMDDFWSKFNQVTLDLYTLPIPTGCAIGGHAIAGGAILALTCDYRYISTGRKLIGLNEIKIGLPVPYLADLILRQIVGDRAATKMEYSGEFLEPEEAQLIGLADSVHSLAELEDQIREKVAEISELPPYGFTFIKENRTAEIRLLFEENRQRKADIFLSCWFDPPVRELLNEAAKKF